MELDEVISIINRAVNAYNGKMQYAIMDRAGSISVGTINCTETEALTLSALQNMVAETAITNQMQRLNRPAVDETSN